MSHILPEPGAPLQCQARTKLDAIKRQRSEDRLVLGFILGILAIVAAPVAAVALIHVGAAGHAYLDDAYIGELEEVIDGRRLAMPVHGNPQPLAS